MPRLDRAGSTVVAQRPDSGSRACGGGATVIGSSGTTGGNARTGRARTRTTIGAVAVGTAGAGVVMARDARARLRQKTELSTAPTAPRANRPESPHLLVWLCCSGD